LSRSIADPEKGIAERSLTCCSLGPGLDAFTVDDHFLPIHHDFGQPFITCTYTMCEQLAQGQAADTSFVHSKEAGLEADEDNRYMWHIQ